MNCYNHPNLPAVSSCIDCNKGLCIECSSRYTFPICVECNKNRISHERSEIIKDFFIIFGGGAVITFIVFNSQFSKQRFAHNVIHYALLCLFFTGCRLEISKQNYSRLFPFLANYRLVDLFYG